MKSIVKIPVSDFPIEPEDVYVTNEESGLNSPIGFQFVHMTGCRQFENFCLVLCTCSGNLAQAIEDSGKDWEIMNVGAAVTSSELIDWISDVQAYDEAGEPVGAPTRPLTVPPLTKWAGSQDWVIV